MAQAASVATRSTFITQLLAPIAAPAARRRFMAELRREAGEAWDIALHRYYAARALREHHAHIRCAAEIERRTPNVSSAAEARAQLAMVEAVDRMMMVPAPTLRSLRHKQKLRLTSGGRDRWEVAIATDMARFKENG